MAKVALYNMEGTKTGDMEVSDAIFAAEVNKSVLHQVVVNYLANQRQGTQSTKTRTEVRGGGIKPWRQKGTGRARQGSIRAPQWTGGGVALGPKPRSYRFSVNKKIKRIALKSALSAKYADYKVFVIDELAVDEIKTAKIVALLKGLDVNSKALIVTADADEKVYKSARNIKGVTPTHVGTLNTYDVLNNDAFIVSKDAIAKIEEVLALMNSFDILRRPIISERSMETVLDREGNEIKRYTFEVPKTVNKVEIKKAVEEAFGVKVAKVNTMNVLGKVKRMGRNEGRRPSWKKAIVTLTADSKTIEFFDI